MRFGSAFLEELRDRLPISEVIGKRVVWDKKKTNMSRGDWWACCPFHGEKTPSFHCEDSKGRYHCFGCGVTGDHFRFLTELEGISFPEAVEVVADIAGVSLPAVDPRSAEREKQRSSLHDVMEMATQYFQNQLQTAQGANARAYLRERGLSGKTIERFRLGFATNSRNALKQYLADKGVEKSQIEACGMVVFGPEISVSYDRFRDRIMFPIPDSRGKIIAFGGRAMSPDHPAKYLNSPETELFHKGNVLYNFSNARRASQGVNGSGYVVAVEGYMDVIALHQAGIECAVAPLGTALTERQLALLWRMGVQPFLCFDGDNAGIRAANRAADLALATLKTGQSLEFAILPENQDPDDLVREQGRAAFDAVIKSARPLAEMIWQREYGGGQFDTPEKRAELEARLKRATGQIQDEVLKRYYSQFMFDKLRRLFDTRSQGNSRGQNYNGRQNYQKNNKSDWKNQRSKGAGYIVSDLLSGSRLVKGPSSQTALRESALIMILINQPALLSDEFDEVSAIEFVHAEVKQLHSTLLDVFAYKPTIERDELYELLLERGFSDILQAMVRQIANARLWVATKEAAGEDAREAFLQAIALHKRTQALKIQKIETERELAEITEAEDEDQVNILMQAMASIQSEMANLESQEAIIDGFGIMSGRIKGSSR